MKNLDSPVAIVAHDAGAANILFAWVAPADLMRCRVVAQGPAAALWRARFGKAALVDDLESALQDARTLLSGTGWASDLEHEARRRAHALGIRSIAVIDHWVNYRMRFERGGVEVLPDEIWVTDSHAAEIARSQIPEVPVFEKPNLYVTTQARAAGPAPADLSGDLLFVSEPARSDWGKGPQGEFQALDYLAEHRAAAGIPDSVRLRVRPHPSDPIGKYDAWIAAHPGAELDRSKDVAEALGPATWVAGLQSFALVIALAAGRTAISVLPPHAPECVLPHAGLKHLRDLVRR